MKVLLLLLPLLLAACDPFGLPENPPDTATYYVTSGESRQGTRLSKVASRIAIEFDAPEGVVRDTLVANDTLALAAVRPRALASWSRVFDRDALQDFSITATNLTVPNDSGDVGFITVSLIVNKDVVAFDSSRTAVSLSY